MAQRIVRAKRKIAAAGHPLRGAARRRPARAAGQRAGHASTWSSTPATGRRCAPSCAPRRSGSARLLVALMPDEGEAIGLLALMLLHDSRRAARVDADGRLVLLADQDRSLWDARGDRRGRDARRARLAARPARQVPDPGVDRRRALARLGLGADRLALRPADGGRRRRRSWRSTAPWRSPSATGPEAGLALMDGLELDGYHLWHAARADLLRRLERARRGGRRLPRRARAHRQRGRARLPCTKTPRT